MAAPELGRAVLELTADDKNLFASLDKGEKATLGLISTFDKAAKAITSGLTQSSQAAEEFSTEVKAAFTSVDVGSRGVASAIQKLIGSDAIERANAYAKAVTAIGGVSKLTASEQQALFATVNAGIQKYQALGIAAPKSLTDTAAAAKSAIGATAALDIEAGQLATAITKVGGASKLTKEDLAKVDQITKDLTSQYVALGREAPASLKSLESESAKLLTASQPLPAHMQFLEQKTTLASKATDLLKGSVAQLASGFAIGNLITSAVGALVSWTKEAIDGAGATLDLSNKTGLSTDTIQKMEFAAKLTSAELSDFTGAAFKLGARLSGGSGSVRQAFEDLRKSSGDLGLTWQQLRTLHPDDQFDAIATSLGHVHNEQERNRIALELFGKGAGAILPAVAEGWTDIASQASITSRAQLEAIDAMSDAWDAFVTNRKKDIGSVLGGLVLAGQEANKLGFLQSMALLASQPLAAPGMLAGMGAADSQKKKPENVDLPTPKVESYVAALKEAEAKVRALSSAEIAEIMAAEKLGKSQDEIINRYGITEEMLSLLKERYSEQKAAISQAAAEAKKFAEAQDHIASSTQDLTGQTRETVKWLLKQGASESDIAIALKVTATQVKEVATIEKVRADALKLADKQAQEFVTNQRKVMDASSKAITDSLTAIDKWNDQLALQGTSGLNRELIQIEQARSAEIKAIVNVGEVESGITKQRRAQIDAFYDHQRDLALGTSNTIVERMHAQGVLTRSELQQQADGFKRNYADMLRTGLYTPAQLQEAWDRYAAALKKIQGDSLAGWIAVGAAAQNLARMIPGVFGEVAGQIGSAISAQVQLAKATRDYNSQLKHSGAETAAYYMQAGTTVLSYYQMLTGLAEKLMDKLTAGQAAPAIAQRGGKSAIEAAGITAGIGVQGGGLLATDSASAFARLLKQFDQAVADSNARLQRYGLTWRDLGDSIQQANIDAATRQLIADRNAFYQLGKSFDESALLMKDGLSQLVVDAVTTGQKIPVALQPMLETLIRSGQLSDEAARKLLGMSTEAVPAFKDVEAAAARYGIEIGKLGPKIQQLRINDLAKQIVSDWNLLQSAGADTNTTLVGMQKAVQDVVTASRQAGVKIPEEMRPVIEAMAKAGLLTDEFGNKLEDTSGLEFEKPLTAEIDDLIAKLDELIAKLSGVGGAADDMGRRIGNAVAIGTAVPRGAAGTGTGETPTPAPTPTPTPTPPTGTSGTGSSAQKRRYAKGGLVEPLHGGFSDWREWSRASNALNGVDKIPAWLTAKEYILDTDTVVREGAAALKDLQKGLATVVPNASLQALSAAAQPSVSFKAETFAMPGLAMPATYRSNTPLPSNFGRTTTTAPATGGTSAAGAPANVGPFYIQIPPGELYRALRDGSPIIVDAINGNHLGTKTQLQGRGKPLGGF